MSDILLTMRPILEDGSWGDKQKKIYYYDEQGNKIRKKNGRYKCTSEDITGWNSRDNAKKWRKDLADTINAVNEKLGKTEDFWEHRSFAERGLDKLPTIHLGEKASAMERAGIHTERGNINRQIMQHNLILEQAKVLYDEAVAKLEQLKESKPVVAVVNEVLELIQMVISRKGRLDLPIMKGKYLSKIPDRSRLQTEEQAVRFVTASQISTFGELKAFSQEKEQEIQTVSNARQAIREELATITELQQLDQNHELSSKDKSIIDRCMGDLYKNYKRGGPLPTLLSLRELLLVQPEPEARDLALSMELFTEGSLNAFAYPTNVNTNNRIVVYDILDLGEQLKTMGLLVITDAILNRVTENWKHGRRTHVYLDEFHVVYDNPYSSMFFNSAWRRFRKRNAFPTGITQNVEYLLDNSAARSILSNSEFVVMHNQAASDREKLAELFNISEDQMKYITNAEAGHGLMKIGNALVPFVNRFPKNTELYRNMTTKPGETEMWG